MLIQSKYRCINCFNELNSEYEKCSCGFDESTYKVLAHTIAPGTILNGMYCVGRVLYSDGVGITYVAIDMKQNRKVVIKEFYLATFAIDRIFNYNTSSVSSEKVNELFVKYKKLFTDGAEGLAKCNQEGIESIYDVFEENKTGYIVKEYIEGYTLKELLKTKGTFQVSEILEIFMPVISNLGKIHKQNIIHGDINPDNIILNEEGKATIADFGANDEILRILHDHSSLSTNHHTPLELYSNRTKIDERTDIYFVCATIYECLTGISPLETVEHAKTVCELQPVYVINEECSKELSDVIMKGMNSKLADRHQTMDELADAIVMAQEDRSEISTVIQVEEEYEKPKTTKKSNKKTGTILFLTAVVAITIAIVGIIVSREKKC